MKNQQLDTQRFAQLHEKLNEILQNNQINLDFHHTDIYMDENICTFLRISVRTLRKLCREGKITNLKLGGRYYYIRQLFFLDLLKIYTD